MLTPHTRIRDALSVEFKIHPRSGDSDQNVYISSRYTRKRTTNIPQATWNSFFGRVCPRRLRPRPHARAARFTPTSHWCALASTLRRRTRFTPVIVRLTRQRADRRRHVRRGRFGGHSAARGVDGPSTRRSRVGGEQGTTVDGGELGPPPRRAWGKNAGRAGVGRSRASAWAAGASREGTGRALGDECRSTSAGGCRLPARYTIRASAVSADPRQCGAF